MLDSLLVALKWAAFGNAIFMMLFLGFRVTFHHSIDWILVDALLVIGSLVIASRYHEDGI